MPTLPVISIPIDLTPPASVLATLAQLTSGLPVVPNPPSAFTQLFLQVLGSIPTIPTLGS